MTTQNNEVLGYITCEAGGRATVHQTKRGKGRYLYTRCDCCGCDQRNGAAVQSRIYHNTEWLSGAPEAPPNLQPKKMAEQPKQPSNDAVVEDFVQPENEPTQPQVTTENEPKGLLLLSIVGLAVGGLALALGRA